MEEGLCPVCGRGLSISISHYDNEYFCNDCGFHAHTEAELELSYANMQADRIITELRVRLADAEVALAEYAEEANWTNEIEYVAEDYRSINANGCPDTYDVTIDVSYANWWRGDGGEGFELAAYYFAKYEEDDNG